MTFDILVRNLRTTEINNLRIEDNILKPGQKECESLKPGEICVLSGQYSLTKEDLEKGTIVSTTTVSSEESDPV